jgi:pyruvate carboxylase
MENLDIYILTSIVATLFIVFFITMYREFSRVSKDGYKHNPNQKMYGRDALFVLASKLFEDKKITKKEKNAIYKAMHQTMADMESDGVRFPEDIKKEIIKNREESICKYSGLPSPKFYESFQQK